ncbi:MAG: hypothetical protein ABEN55_20300 [Bradymonadaceae bacterium]
MDVHDIGFSHIICNEVKRVDVDLEGHEHGVELSPTFGLGVVSGNAVVETTLRLHTLDHNDERHGLVCTVRVEIWKDSADFKKVTAHTGDVPGDRAKQSEIAADLMVKFVDIVKSATERLEG